MPESKLAFDVCLKFLLLVSIVKWWLSRNHGVAEHPNTECIDLQVVLLPSTDLGSDVTRATANSSYRLILRLHFGTHAKINELDLVVRGDHYILQLQISMRNAHLVQIPNCLEQLLSDYSSYWLFQEVLIADQVEQSGSLCQVHN
jgi:hypothetical protein